MKFPGLSTILLLCSLFFLSGCDDDEPVNFIKFKADGKSYSFNAFLTRECYDAPLSINIISDLDKKGYGVSIFITDMDFSSVNTPVTINQDSEEYMGEIYFDRWKTPTEPDFMSGAYLNRSPIKIKILSISEDFVIVGEFSCEAKVFDQFQEHLGKERIVIKDGIFKVKLTYLN